MLDKKKFVKNIIPNKLRRRKKVVDKTIALIDSIINLSYAINKNKKSLDKVPHIIRTTLNLLFEYVGEEKNGEKR